MRILHVVPGLARQLGGPSNTVVGIARAIRSLGGDNAIFTTDLREPAGSRIHTRASSADFPTGAETLNIKLFRASKPYRFAYSSHLAEALQREAHLFDVVHIHSLFLYPQLAAFRAARHSGVPHLVTPHGALDPALRGRNRVAKNAMTLLWQRAMLDTAAAVHFTTQDEARLCGDLAIVAPPAIVPNGIDWASFQGDGDPDGFRRTWGLRDDFVVLFLGRISHKKGMDVLIRSLRQIDATKQVRLVIAGPDDEHLLPGLQRLAEELGVADRVVYTGMLERDARLSALQACDVWALPSTTENFGNAVMEAMAAGVPTVISPEVNLASSVQQAHAGVVVERSPQAFAAAIGELAACPHVRCELGGRAREFARAYDWSRVGLKLARMYEGVLSAGVRGSKAKRAA